MAISRLQAALIAATNDVTVAAANINFDFTLVKCEAPKEYQDLGNALSTKRKERAETGSIHITARRLGALFDGVCDASPKLIKAYGRRVSEIAALTKEEPDNVKDSLLGPLIGIDGTSIWAAATSSPSALHVQLLACMLARLWSAAEAVSMWDELVRERRNEIARRFEEGTAEKFATVTAAVQADISRSSLAEWDASARAWLRCADRVKRTKQDQLMLIVGNVNIPIANEMGVYLSVKAAWRSAVESMEKLVVGMPQAGNCGPTLLALSAWHLYPDILTFGGDSKAQVRFNDSEIAEGGVLSIGLALPDGGEARGVYWSLSLAHLTHYGRPIRREQTLSHSAERLSFTQFTLVVLGCVLGYWSTTGGDARTGASLFVEVHRFMQRAVEKYPQGSISHVSASSLLRDSWDWWNILSDAASTWLECDGEADEVHKLVRLGMRRSQRFFSAAFNPGDLYSGLTTAGVIIGCMTDTEQRISYLRRKALHEGLSSSQGQFLTLIRFSTDLGGCYATAVPLATTVRKRRHGEDNETIEYLHRRWLHPGHAPHPSEMCLEIGSLFVEPQSTGRFFVQVWNEISLSYEPYSVVYGSTKTAAILQRGYVPATDVRSASIEDSIYCLQQDLWSVDKIIDHIRVNLDLSGPVNELKLALRPLAMLSRVMPSARISIGTFDRPIRSAKWYEVYSRKKKSRLPKDGVINRAVAFACVAYMVAGVDVDPTIMEHVFAMAYEDSLYVDMRLLCDPSVEPELYEMVHAIGNVGRPGLTLLIPPKEPIVRALHPSSWKLVSNKTFNGETEDCFRKTTMHLSFTEYYRPAHFGDEQGQDSQIHFLESVVSVHDAGEWVGDVDIPKSLERPEVKRFFLTCKDSGGHRNARPFSSSQISAEGWNDILDAPIESVVIRAYDNWIARLAAVGILGSISGGNNRFVWICGQDCCWRCVIEAYDQQKIEKTGAIYIF